MLSVVGPKKKNPNKTRSPRGLLLCQTPILSGSHAQKLLFCYKKREVDKMEVHPPYSGQTGVLRNVVCGEGVSHERAQQAARTAACSIPRDSYNSWGCSTTRLLLKKRITTGAAGVHKSGPTTSRYPLYWEPSSGAGAENPSSLLQLLGNSLFLPAVLGPLWSYVCTPFCPIRAIERESYQSVCVVVNSCLDDGPFCDGENT